MVAPLVAALNTTSYIGSIEDNICQFGGKKHSLIQMNYPGIIMGVRSITDGINRFTHTYC